MDYEVYLRYEEVINEFLNVENPNVQSLNTDLIDKLNRTGIIKRESDTNEPSTTLRIRSKKSLRDDKQAEVLSEFFPMLYVPTAPPRFGIAPRKSQSDKEQKTPIATPPQTVGNISTFIMQLSAFDSSHRPGVPGTPEVLIPLEARDFFPQLTLQANRKHPDANFDVELDTPTGQERHSYRAWFYEERGEFRLRMNGETIELSTPEGGDLIVINRLPEDSDPPYEVTILPQSDPIFPIFMEKCVKVAQGKKWGIVTN